MEYSRYYVMSEQARGERRAFYVCDRTRMRGFDEKTMSVHSTRRAAENRAAKLNAEISSPPAIASRGKSEGEG